VEPPTIVCITQASNVCGLMPPVLEIARLAKQANPQSVVVVDGAQVAGLYPLSLKEGLIDALIFSGHKSFYGPYGVAGVVLSSSWKPALLLYGGTGTFSESIEMPKDTPSAYEAGSHNMWAIAGLYAALQWLAENRRGAIVEQSIGLAQYLRSELTNVPGVQLCTPPGNTQWCAILSFTVDGIPPQTIETVLGAEGIAVRAGLHCAPWSHEWLGTIENGGTVRVSPGFFNSVSEIEIFLSIIKGILNFPI
jgi:selenocysteine lyase/cysteine desulfurase